MKQITVGVVVALLIGGLALFFLGRGEPQAKYEDITPAKAQAMLKEGKAVFIDVREQYEYDAGHIPGITLIPLGTLGEKLPTLDKTKTYVIVCRSGNRSGQAARLMLANGFKTVYNMSGGMNAWRGEVVR